MQTILVCDDDKQIVEAINIYLTGEGFEVIKAYDGYEALEYLEDHEVNLMIVDVMMPGLDGIRTTLKVRETSSIPIIILSAKSEDTDKILGLNIGADDYITKPFNPLELFAAAKECGRKLGLSFSHQFVGGGSDGNAVSAMGIPTLDGLGGWGDGAHSESEYLRISQYIPRIALLASLILDIR